MPAKNSIKEYVDDGYYHIYNRGVEKRVVFPTSQDYAVFLSYMKTYVLPKDMNSLQQIISNPESPHAEKDKALKMLRLNNFSDTLSLLSYCLMPNHFHLVVHQTELDIIDEFMNSLSTRYCIYFNRKYKRVGPLFQGVYKAVLIKSDEQLLYVTRYVHRNPKDIRVQGEALHSLEQYPYSSYPIYLGIKKADWVKPETVLSFFSRKKSLKNSYQEFVEEQDFNEDQTRRIHQLGIEY